MRTFLLLFFDNIVETIPYIILCGYPFKRHFRFTLKKTVLVTLFMLLGLSAVYSFLGVYYETVLPKDRTLYAAINATYIFLLIPYLIWYLYAVKEIWQKKLFIFLFALTNAMFINAVFNIVVQFVPDLDYSWLPASAWSISTSFVVGGVFVPLLCLFIKHFYLPVEDGMNAEEIWAVSVPLIIIFAIFSVFFSSADIFFIMENPTSLMLYFGIIVTVYILYAIIFGMYRLAHQRHMADEKYMESQYQVTIRDEQYKRIFESIENVSRQRHDIRHHMLILQEFLNNGNTEKASEYLKQYLEVTQKKTADKLCGNPIVNMLASHYCGIAEERGIEFSAHINVPDELPIQDTDISVILGNLLENAVEAASCAEGESRRISLNIGLKGKMLAITVDNGYSGDIKQSGGKYLSSKSERRGLGLESVSEIAEKYGGGAEFHHNENMFFSSVMLIADVPEKV